MTPSTFTVDPAGWQRSEGRPWRIAAAIGVALLLHALLLFGPRWGGLAPASQQQPGTLPPLSVWLVPPAPPKPAPPAVAAMPQPKSATATAPRGRARPARVEPAAAPAVMTSTASAPAATQVPDDSAPAAPRFNMDAALSTARSVANERDPAKANTAVGQIPDKPLQTETQLARDIGSAKRANCKDGVPGGLLAPIFLLMDKKDSGCKW